MLTANINDIDNMGKVTLRFNQPINNVSFQDINKTVLDLYVLPANNRHLDEEQFDLKKLNFTWKLMEW